MESKQPYADPLGLIAFFDARFSQAFQRGLVELVFDCYRRTNRECTDTYLDSVAHDVRPQICRAKIENGLPALAARFSGIDARSERNSTRSNNHMEIIAEGLVLTESIAPSPRHPIDDALFRRDLARRGQPPLPGLGIEPPLVASAYAVLMHGSTAYDRSRPSFLQIVFPDRNCATRLARIDLLRRFPDVGRIDTAVATPVPEPRLRRTRKKTTDSTGRDA